MSILVVTCISGGSDESAVLNCPHVFHRFEFERVFRRAEGEGGTRNAHPFPSSLLCLPLLTTAPRDWEGGIVINSSPSLSSPKNLASHILNFYSIAPPYITTSVVMETLENAWKVVF